MRVRATVTTTADYELNPQDYGFSDEATVLTHEQGEVEADPACLLNLSDVKIKVDIRKIENTP